ncbi:aminoglycoside phosphotransferase family protein [Hydrogenovibrio crunogenus]|uniref:Aminoglycoside phosphotransferase family protein n=1 Tax=Hydrogenovibrio crunogenus TaxID=39765 RepID=A0A4V1C944_9GAMM|nr:hypothetical protein [Hydrogenovibrio crunogenus]QBZ84114.1 aminoglycoside phosphotransferase family protein [Hydrogenovibrio crunogenus]
MHSIPRLKPYFSNAETRSFEQIPSLYDDSSHTIFLHETASQKEVIKALNSQSAEDSPFWQGMAEFFGVHLKQQLQHFDSLYPLIAQYSPLEIPALLQTLVVPNESIWAIKTDFLPGQSVQSELVTSQMVRQLAEHLACLHQVESDQFGYIFGKTKTETKPSWPQHVKQQLTQLLSVHPLLNSTEQEALLGQIDARFQPSEFGVIMPDLRWDQFLQQENALTGLTDLDALVFGPVELDWVLLEYLLKPEQAQLFCAEYERHRAIPEIGAVRSVYRVMLFLMNVLGEKNYQAWRDYPALFV